ncbi:MAG: hypothetical protein PHE24_03370 [Patescibacteria group bacterium]|nr:hypothetical protein [Patescibacteria group bacterium]
MKRIIYLISWVVLGLLLSFLAHAAIEIVYINYALAHSLALVNHGAFGHIFCVLPFWLQVSLPVLGIAGGFCAGVFFWRVIYIEKRYKKTPFKR